MLDIERLQLKEENIRKDIGFEKSIVCTNSHKECDINILKYLILTIVPKEWDILQVKKYFMIDLQIRPCIVGRAINEIRYIRVEKNFNFKIKALYINKKVKKTYFSSIKECYFCGNLEVIEHHLSYNPQKVLYFCRSCHSKTHYLYKEYHNLIVKKDNFLKQIGG